MIDAILKFLGWYCDPGEALLVPVDSAKVVIRSKRVTIPDEITISSNGKAYKTTHDESGLESVEVTIGRNPSRTKYDDEVLSIVEKGKPTINPNKYFRLKVFWAKGLSAKATAQALSNERGFGVRTLDLYWERFAMSQRLEETNGKGTKKRSSPLVVEF